MRPASLYLPHLLGFCALLSFSALRGQVASPDSLRQWLDRGPDDSVKVFRYYEYGEQFELKNPDSADYYFKKGLALARRLNYAKGIFSYTSYAIVLLNNQGRYAEALALTRESAELAEQSGNERDLTIAWINIANEWQYLGDLPAAAEYYLKAARLAARQPERKFERVALNNLASVFIELKEFEKVIQYASQALTIAREMNDEYAIASCLINRAVGHTGQRRFAEADADYRQVIGIGKKTDDYILVLDGLHGLGENAAARGDHRASGEFFRQELELARGQDASAYLMYGHGGLASALFATGDLTGARRHIDSAIRIARDNGSRLELRGYYRDAARYEEAARAYPEALSFHRLYEELSDSLMNQERQSAILLAEARYQGEKKAQQLALQAALLRQKNTWNGILIGSTALLALILFLLFRNFRQRRQLQEKRIRELEQEKQLSATQSLLRGQEEERNRLARDLHDGLGGLLSGVKLQLGAMKGNLILSEEHGRMFANALARLDDSIQEMRRVAHNMMPEALLKLGLRQALQDYCEALSKGQPFTIRHELYGLEERLPPDTEVVVYRIVQELLNNAVKHAGATTILAQVMKQGAILTITVEDNGRGFDPGAVSGGAGFQNIRSRVDYLKGQLDIRSVPGKGSSFHIECKLNEQQ